MTLNDIEIKNLALPDGPTYNLVAWRGGKREMIFKLAPGMAQVVPLAESQTLQLEPVRASAAPKPGPKHRVQPEPTSQPFPAATGKADVPVGTPVPAQPAAGGMPVTLAGNSNEVAGGE